MKESIFNIAFFTQLIVILMIQCTLVFGQKLPKTQTSSLLAPANIKIDGKTTEWNNQFQAHNSGNHIYYTLSNDDKNLYLTAQMDDIDGGKKILKGGITFTIIPLAKTANKVSVTFPVMSTEKRGESNHLNLYRTLKSDTVANKANIDSLIVISNREITKDYKEIYVTGIPEISDPLLSIYNTQGIIAGASFDKKMSYTYELAIPLKYLKAAINDVKSLKYNITLNALSPIIKAEVYSGPPVRELTVATPLAPPSFDDMFKYDDTDFSGVYTLALKQP